MILRQLAELLTQTTREYDTVARYGGEESTLLYPQTPPRSAIEIVAVFRPVGEQITVACFRVDQGQDIFAAIGEATIDNNSDGWPAISPISDDKTLLL